MLAGGNIDATTLISVTRFGLTSSGRYLVVAILIPDRPGQLARIVAAVAAHKANVLSVTHHREGRNIGVLETEAELTLETRGEEHSQALVAALVADGLHRASPDAEAAELQPLRLSRSLPPRARQSTMPPSTTGRASKPWARRMLAAITARGPVSQIVTTGRSSGRSAQQVAISRYGTLRLPGIVPGRDVVLLAHVDHLGAGGDQGVELVDRDRVGALVAAAEHVPGDVEEGDRVEAADRALRLVDGLGEHADGLRRRRARSPPSSRSSCRRPER